MSQPVKLPVFIAVVVAALVVFGLIGYKMIIASNPPPRKMDAVMQAQIMELEKAREAKISGGKGMTPPSPPHP